MPFKNSVAVLDNRGLGIEAVFSDLDLGLELAGLAFGLGLEPSGLDLDLEPAGLGPEPSGLGLDPEDLVVILISSRPRPRQIKNMTNICNL